MLTVDYTTILCDVSEVTLKLPKAPNLLLCATCVRRLSNWQRPGGVALPVVWLSRPRNNYCTACSGMHGRTTVNLEYSVAAFYILTGLGHASCSGQTKIRYNVGQNSGPFKNISFQSGPLAVVCHYRVILHSRGETFNKTGAFEEL